MADDEQQQQQQQQAQAQAQAQAQQADQPADELLDEEELGADADEEEGPSDGVPRKNVNVVFIGHVDAGKSTISGHLMYLTGEMDQRTLDKFEREAKAKNRESWKFAWCMDLTEQERNKGKTEELGRGSFVTPTKRFTILDAPGHKAFVPHMIGGASQADIGILVISARKGEFETGFERGGQTREHALLAKTAGVKQLIVAINKMDDPTVEWSKARYDECVERLMPFLRQVGFNPKADIIFMPISGLSGYNLKERVPADVCPWFEGEPLLDVLENLKPPQRLFDLPLRMPVIDKYREMGCVVMGKLESGTIRKGESLLLMPNRVPVEVTGLYIESIEVPSVEPGDSPKIRLRGVEEEEVRMGFVLCPPNDPCHFTRTFDAQVIILEHKSIICAGYSSVMHLHSCIEECTLERLIAQIDRKNNTVIQKHPKFVKPGMTVIARITTTQPVCVETFKDFPQMGRFMLRDEGKTIAVGVVTRLHLTESA